MRFDTGIKKKYRHSIEDAFQTILQKGNDEHRRVMKAILDSEMKVCVFPVSRVQASGITGVTNPRETNRRIMSERLSLQDALGEIFITIAEETIDTGGQRGCEGTFVHEGRHAYDFAAAIASFSDTEVNPLGIFNPTLYELEWAAHKAAGDYMIQVNTPDFLTEGLQLLILGETGGKCFVDDDGIECRLRDSYGLDLKGNQGAQVTEMFGLTIRG